MKNPWTWPLARILGGKWLGTLISSNLKRDYREKLFQESADYTANIRVKAQFLEKNSIIFPFPLLCVEQESKTEENLELEIKRTQTCTFHNHVILNWQVPAGFSA